MMISGASTPLGILLFCSLIYFLHQVAGLSSSKASFCPLRNTVTSCTPRCFSDWECSGDRKCCPNICDTTSCAETSPVQVSDDFQKNGNLGAVYCDNVKCQPKQFCKTDPKTRRQYCTFK